MSESKSSRVIAADITGTVLTINVAGVGAIIVDAGVLSYEIRTAAMMHGLKQKIADAAAMERDPETGRSATAEDKYRAMRAVADRLNGGEWNKRADGDGDVRGGYLFRALMEATGKSADDIRAYLADKTKAQCHAMRESPKIKPIIDRMKAAEDKPAADATDLLAEIGL